MTPCRLLSRYRHIGRASRLLISGSQNVLFTWATLRNVDTLAQMHMTSYRRRWTSSSVPLCDLWLFELVFTKETTNWLSAPPAAVIFSISKWKTGLTILTNVEPYFRKYIERSFTPVTKHHNEKKQGKVKIKLNLH
jgi:hypothetical protein